MELIQAEFSLPFIQDQTFTGYYTAKKTAGRFIPFFTRAVAEQLCNALVNLGEIESWQGTGKDIVTYDLHCDQVTSFSGWNTRIAGQHFEIIFDGFGYAFDWQLVSDTPPTETPQHQMDVGTQIRVDTRCYTDTVEVIEYAQGIIMASAVTDEARVYVLDEAQVTVTEQGEWFLASDRGIIHCNETVERERKLTLGDVVTGLGKYNPSDHTYTVYLFRSLDGQDLVFLHDTRNDDMPIALTPRDNIQFCDGVFIIQNPARVIYSD